MQERGGRSGVRPPDNLIKESHKERGEPFPLLPAVRGRKRASVFTIASEQLGLTENNRGHSVVRQKAEIVVLGTLLQAHECSRGSKKLTGISCAHPMTGPE